MLNKSLTFSRVDSAKFFKTLNGRVNEYFKSNNLKRTGNWQLWLKTIVMFLIFLVPYFLMMTIDLPGWVQILFTIVMGIGMAGVGMNVMHDGNHGSFSNKSWVNKMMGSSIYNWQEMFITGKFNTMFYITHTQIFTDMTKI